MATPKFNYFGGNYDPEAILEAIPRQKLILYGATVCFIVYSAYGYLFGKKASVPATATKETRIKHHNAIDYRNAFDDALRRTLETDLKFTETHTHTDRKLILGFLACIFAFYGSIYSYFYVPWPDCYWELTLSVAAYFVFSTLHGAYARFVEKDVIYLGVRRDSALHIDPDVPLEIHSTLPQYSDQYTLRFVFTIPGGKTKEVKSTKSFGNFFDAEGLLVETKVQEYIAGIVNGALNTSK